MKKNMFKIVLGIMVILILMIPIFIFSNAEKKKNNYNKLIESIESAAEKWAKSSDNELNSSTVKLGELKDKRLIGHNLKNPKTGLHLSDETYVVVKENGNKYEFELKLYDIPKKETNNNLIVSMIGDKKIQNGISVRYEEKGISIRENGEEISYSVQYFLKGEEVISIDSSRPKVYEAVYTAINSKGEIAKIVREIVVQ